jgi:hypothetical protein
MQIVTTAMVVFGLWLFGTFLVPSPRVVEEVKETGSGEQVEPDAESDAATSRANFKSCRQAANPEPPPASRGRGSQRLHCVPYGTAFAAPSG